MKRQIALDTETTGLNFLGITHEGHNIIEIGAVEIINRRLTGNNFHVYLKPSRLIDKEAFKIHGISNKFLKNKPTFKEIVPDLIKYIQDSELIIHNAPFDVGFLNYEFKNANINFKIEDRCDILDTLVLSRKKYPKQKNKLDDLCARFKIDTSQRTRHSALLDAKLLAQVYLYLTRGQLKLDILPKAYSLNDVDNNDTDEWISKNIGGYKHKNIVVPELPLIIFYPSKQEILKHENILKLMQSNNISLWLELEKKKDR